MYVYIESEPGLWTVGHYRPNRAGMGADFVSESDHETQVSAARRVNYLNGGTGLEYEAWN